MRTIVFLLTLTLFLFVFGHNLNPFSNEMFEFHDETQPAKIQQFALNLKNLQIPPRMAPEFSFGLGYPVFNFYAPSSYWITSIFSLAGFDPVSTLKLSFLSAFIVAFCCVFLFLRKIFSFYASLSGTFIYSTAIYFAVDIFVRGNLAETWFLALLPLTLYLFLQNEKTKNRFLLIATIFSLSLLLTVHNLLSLIAIPIIVIFIALLKDKKMNSIAFISGLLLCSYFFIPLLLELPLTYAKEVAQLTDFHAHFLCPQQLWQSQWGYGGSAQGCVADGMSFMLGKIQIILFTLGIFAFLLHYFHKKEKSRIGSIGVFFIILTFFTLFLTTYASQFIWDKLSFIFSYIQFPWRFIAFSLLSISFFSAFAIESLNFLPKKYVCFLLIGVLCIFNSRYFYHPPISKAEFEKKYLSVEYIHNTVAFRIAEYLPKTANYPVWKTTKPMYIFKENLFKKVITVSKPSEITLPITYFPYWTIMMNGIQYVPLTFDLLGRPIVKLEQPTLITILYNQSTIEKIGNTITLATIIFLFSLGFSEKLWKKITT